ncbi:zinc-binding domain-containing protein, partial [Salmonella sp. gx-f5]|nr:zinc-binding domain-containing protein [Salmonella sp. gx-f5]
KWVWHSALPKKMSITMWKAIHDCLPVDDRIRKIGISIVSRCDCCSNSKYEDLNHSLSRGDFAEKIWRICSVVIGVPWMEGGSWRQRVECW